MNECHLCGYKYLPLVANATCPLCGSSPRDRVTHKIKGSKQQKAFIIYEDELESLFDSRFKQRINLYKTIRSRKVPDPEKWEVQ